MTDRHRRLVHVTAAIALLAGASGDQAAASGTGEALQRGITRVEHGLPRVEKDGTALEMSLQEWMDALGIPGASIAVINDYEIMWAKGYGTLEARVADSPVTDRTLFQAASISKPVVALALLHQVERGTFDLDGNINDYLRSWKLPASDIPGAEKVTLRQLLAHTAGVTPGGFAGFDRDAQIPTTAEILSGEPPATNPPARAVFVPDSAVAYSGLGYTMIELALVDHLGQPLEQVVSASVFRPVGMRSSTFEQVLPDSLASRAAHGHYLMGAPIAGGWNVHPQLAAAGLWTTASDLARMAIDVALSGAGRSNLVLSPEMTRQMLAQHKEQMGLGLVVRPGDPNGSFAHSGGNQGYRCFLEMLAGTGQGVVIMTNSDAGEVLIPLLRRSVAQAYEWPPDWRRPVSEALADAAFAQIAVARTRRTKIE